MTGLYKAKNKESGKWVEGYYQKRHDIDGSFKHLIFWSKSPTVWAYEEIDPETLCRYIGKNDDNFEKIMEHDVMSINTYDYMEPAEDFFGEVVYCEAWACWCIKQPDDEKPIPLCECEGSYKTEIKIHGNIFDNPDLMEGTAE